MFEFCHVHMYVVGNRAEMDNEFPILHGYPTDSDIIKLVFLTLYICMYVQPQAKQIKDFRHIFTALMLTSNTVSNHKSYFDMQNPFPNCPK